MRTSRLLTMLALLGVLAGAAACQTLSGRSAGRYIDDKTITASVKGKLVADRAVNLTRINVTTINGIVSLDGVADTLEDKSRAEGIASRVDGVRSVVNNVQVRAPASASPR